MTLTPIWPVEYLAIQPRVANSMELTITLSGLWSRQSPPCEAFSVCGLSGLDSRSLARPRPRRGSGLKPSRSMKRPRLCHGRGGSVGWAGNHRRTIRRPPLLLSTGSTDERDRKAIQRHHHITLCVGGAQEDYDFHTKVLGLKSVKKTALYDGDVPIYHLYYGNDRGRSRRWSRASPCASPGGGAARHESGQDADAVGPRDGAGLLAQPAGRPRHRRRGARGAGRETARLQPSLRHRLRAGRHGRRRPPAPLRPDRSRRTRHPRHPRDHRVGARPRTCPSTSWPTAGAGTSPRRNATGPLRSSARAAPADRRLRRRAQLDQASWMYGEGIVHHTAFQVADYDVQTTVKFHLEGLGFTDVSDARTAATSSPSTSAPRAGPSSRRPCPSRRAS